MALSITHPDYMTFNGCKRAVDEYSVEHYREYLEHVKTTYEGQYWHALPREVARYVSEWRAKRPKHKKQTDHIPQPRVQSAHALP